jgi:hypothetical protein
MKDERAEVLMSSEDKLAKINLLRVEIENIRLRNAELNESLAPYEEWVGKIREKLDEYDGKNIDKDLDSRDKDKKPAKMKKRDESVDWAEENDDDPWEQPRRGRPPKQPRQSKKSHVKKEPAPSAGSSRPAFVPIMLDVEGIGRVPFPFPFRPMQRITSNSEILVPGTYITLNSKMYELFRVRPDLYRMLLMSSERPQ